MSFMALAVCEENWKDAIHEGNRYSQTRADAVHTLLPFMSEVEQSQYLRKEKPWTYPLPVARLRPDDPEIAAATAEWVLNGKAVTIEVLCERARLARGDGGAEAQRLMDELKVIRAKLTRLKDAGRTAATEEIAPLLAAEAEASKQLGRLTARNTRERPWVKLADLQKTLAADAAVVEIVAAKDRDFKPDKEKPERYFAWVIRRDAVHFVDLGPCEPIDAKVADILADMDFEKVGGKVAGNVGRAIAGAREELAALSKLTFHPLAKHLGGVKTLTVSPSEGLWLAPWAALLTPADKYLVEEYAVSMAITARDRLPGGPRPPAPNPPVLMGNPDFGEAVAGGPRRARNAYLDGARERGVAVRSRSLEGAVWLPLPGTEKEISRIRPRVEDLAGKSVVHLGKGATEAEFKKVVRPRHLVLSTHGFFLPPAEDKAKNAPPKVVPATTARLVVVAPHGAKVTADGAPLPNGWTDVKNLAAGQKVKATVAVTFADKTTETREVELTAGKATRTFFRAAETTALAAHLENPLVRCGLALAGANKPPAADADDGILTGLEIVGTDLFGTELVVLSACETGAQDAKAGESVAGLRHAFQLAGARAVAATLWKIPDDETADLSGLMWDALAKGRTPADALADAQRAMIARNDKARHPYYWAAFNVTTK